MGEGRTMQEQIVEGYDCMDAGGRATHGAVAEDGVIYNDPLPLAPSLREGEKISFPALK